MIQLVASDEKAVIELGNGRVTTRVGEADEPDLTIAGPANAVLGLVMGLLDTSGATDRGVALHGRRDLVDRLVSPGLGEN